MGSLHNQYLSSDFLSYHDFKFLWKSAIKHYNATEFITESYKSIRISACQPQVDGYDSDSEEDQDSL